MKLVDKEISLEELSQMSGNMFESLVKAVVDLEKEIMVANADLHADQEALLVEMGSEQKNLWGINLHPNQYPQNEWIDFNSLINFRPTQNNRSKSIEDSKIQSSIRKIVSQLIVCNINA
jgi:hypothetical protein